MKSKIDRSNHRRSSAKKGVLKNFANFTRKHPCFPVKFAKVLGTPIMKTISKRLLLHRGCGCDRGDIILNRSNNSEISIDTSGLQQAGDILIKQYFGISNITGCRQKRFSYWLFSKQSMSNHFSLCQDMRFLLAFQQQLINPRYSIEFGLRTWKR